MAGRAPPRRLGVGPTAPVRGALARSQPSRTALLLLLAAKCTLVPCSPVSTGSNVLDHSPPEGSSVDASTLASLLGALTGVSAKLSALETSFSKLTNNIEKRETRAVVEVGTPILRATALSATAQGKCDGLTGHTKVQCEKKGDDKTETAAEDATEGGGGDDKTEAEKDAEEADKDAKVQKSTCATFVDDKQACCKASGEAGHLCSYDVSRTDLQNTFAGYIRGLCVPKGEASEDACERMTATFQDRDAVQGGLGETQDFLAVGDKDSGSSAYVTPTQLASNQPYPGIDYLGAGYDIIHGNPKASSEDMLDPGFRQPVRRIDYTENWMTRDAQYRTPTGSYSMPLKSCYRSETFSNVGDTSSYANALAIDAAVEASYEGMGCGGAFKASVGYKQTRNLAASTKTSRFDSTSYCNKYFASWLHAEPSPEELTPQFLYQARLALEELQCEWPEGLYNTSKAQYRKAQKQFGKLFQVYGTHFITELALGGKVIYEKYTRLVETSEADTMDATLGVEASGKAYGFEASLAMSMELNEARSGAKTKSSTGSKITVMGGVPVGDANTVEGFAAWADTVSTNPMPIQYKLAPLTALGPAIQAALSAHEPPSPPPPDVVPLLCVEKCFGVNGTTGVVWRPKVWCALTDAQERLLCNGCPKCISLASSVQCPGVEGYCDCDWDGGCGGEFCQCADAQACCGARPPPPPQSALPAPPKVCPSQAAELFTAAYKVFYDTYLQASVEEATFDSGSNLLILGGADCIADLSFGTESGKHPFPDSVDYLGSETAGPTEAEGGPWWRRHNKWLEDWCTNTCFSVKHPKFKETKDSKTGRITKVHTDGKNVAVAFKPSSENSKQPMCKCFSSCPKLAYDPRSVDVQEPTFGLTLKVKCGHEDMVGSSVCDPANYDPWPQESTPKTAFAGADGAGACDNYIDTSVTSLGSLDSWGTKESCNWSYEQICQDVTHPYLCEQLCDDDAACTGYTFREGAGTVQTASRCGEFEGGLCGMCQGHCNYDSDCAPGLLCFLRPKGFRGSEPLGSEPLIGCEGEVEDYKNYCMPKIGAIENVGGDGCTTGSPCDVCGGDCDKDSDCKIGMKCLQRHTFEYYGQHLVGCSGELQPDSCSQDCGWDYCMPASTIIFDGNTQSNPYPLHASKPGVTLNGEAFKKANDKQECCLTMNSPRRKTGADDRIAQYGGKRICKEKKPTPCDPQAASPPPASPPQTVMLFSEGETNYADPSATASVLPNTAYDVVVEVLRNDLGGIDERVTDIRIDGVSIGDCNPDGGDYDCTFFNCNDASTIKTPQVTSTASGKMKFEMKLTGHSWDCDCDKTAWTSGQDACSKESTVAGRKPMTAVARITLRPRPEE